MTSMYALSCSTNVFLETYRYLQKANLPEANLSVLKIQWAKSLLNNLNVDLEIVGKSVEEPSTLYVGNHISYLDIPLLMSTVASISFVAKQELSLWPVFGKGAQKLDTIFVKRESTDSRKNARTALQKALIDGKRITIFPSGTTCVDERKPWRLGAFEIAHATNVWVQPFRIHYKPLREVAYIDNDCFPIHLFKLFSLGRIDAQLEFHDPIKITDPKKDCDRWYKWSQGLNVTDRD